VRHGNHLGSQPVFRSSFCLMMIGVPTKPKRSRI
jgi:hypothetical protein